MPREELHTFHVKQRRKQKMVELPDLENYFNNLDENNRLQHEKERSDDLRLVFFFFLSLFLETEAPVFFPRGKFFVLDSDLCPDAAIRNPLTKDYFHSFLIFSVSMT